jgi:hypothetical protein
MVNLHCNEPCEYNIDMDCTAGHVYYVNRLCVTFRRKRRDNNYRKLMQPDVGICHREHGSMKHEGRGGLVK